MAVGIDQTVRKTRKKVKKCPQPYLSISQRRTVLSPGTVLPLAFARLSLILELQNLIVIQAKYQSAPLKKYF